MISCLWRVGTALVVELRLCASPGLAIAAAAVAYKGLPILLIFSDSLQTVFDSS